MIALALSLLFAAYLLIPNALFRFILGRFVPLRIFQERETEDLTRAVVTLAILYAMALCVVWYVPGLKSHPFSFPDSRSLRGSDYKTVASGLYSEAMFREYGSRFWEALRRTLDRQGRLLVWYYVLVCVAGLMAGRGCRHYGKLRQNRIFSTLADLYLMPHISQWYVILTPFTFQDSRTVVKAEVLMTEGLLYRGEVADHFLNKEGDLSGLFLANPERYDRTALLKERETWGSNRPASKFWKQIPSAKLYLVADKIVNLNLHYEPPTASESSIARYLEMLKTLQKRSEAQPISVTIGPAVKHSNSPDA